MGAFAVAYRSLLAHEEPKHTLERLERSYVLASTQVGQGREMALQNLMCVTSLLFLHHFHRSQEASL